MLTKDKLQNDVPQIGSWITLAHPAIAEIMSKAGFSWLAVDLEHSVITIREAEELIRIINLCQITPLVRLTANNPEQIKRVMDAGAHGIIVPMINNKNDARLAVQSVYYPPIGKRGVGLARAQAYGPGFESYRQWITKEPIIIVQIEHIDALPNLKDIFSTEHINGYIIGPYDLSSSMGLGGQFDHPKVKEAIAYIHMTAKQMNLPGGIHLVEPDRVKLQQLVAENHRFIAYSVDIRMLDVSCRQGLSVLEGTKSKNMLEVT